MVMGNLTHYCFLILYINDDGYIFKFECGNPLGGRLNLLGGNVIGSLLKMHRCSSKAILWRCTWMHL
jgi:hypothetical protein